MRHVDGDLCPFLFRGGLEAFLFVLAGQPVVGCDVAHAGLSQQGVALIHLDGGPLEDLLGPFRLGDDRAHQVRDVPEAAQLDHFRVDQNQLDHVRPLRHQDGRDNRIDAHALARAGRAGDQHVRHLSQVVYEGPAAGVLAQKQRQRHLLSHRARQGHQLFEPNLLLVQVGHLDADRVLAGERGDHANTRGTQGTGDVVRQRRHLAHLDARGRLQLEHRDHRAAVDLHHVGLDPIVREGAFENLGLLADHRLLLRIERIFRVLKDGDRRKLPFTQLGGIGFDRQGLRHVHGPGRLSEFDDHLGLRGQCRLPGIIVIFALLTTSLVFLVLLFPFLVFTFALGGCFLGVILALVLLVPDLVILCRRFIGLSDGRSSTGVDSDIRGVRSPPAGGRAGQGEFPGVQESGGEALDRPEQP